MTPKRHAIAQGVLKTSLSNTTLAGRFVFCPRFTPPDKTDLHFIRACGRELYEVSRQSEKCAILTDG